MNECDCAQNMHSGLGLERLDNLLKDRVKTKFVDNNVTVTLWMQFKVTLKFVILIY